MAIEVEDGFDQGWDPGKNVKDFLRIADNMELEGQVSRAEAIRYLVNRVCVAEGHIPLESQ